jgi:glutamyl-tRNA reductase
VRDRKREAQRAEAIIDAEVERFLERLSTLDVVPTIVSLQEHLENIRQAELDRARGRIGSLTPAQEQAIDAMTRGLVNKILHTPITTLKTAAKQPDAPDASTVVDLVRRIFNLNEAPKTSAAAAGNGTAHAPSEKNATRDDS